MKLKNNKYLRTYYLPKIMMSHNHNNHIGLLFSCFSLLATKLSGPGTVVTVSIAARKVNVMVCGIRSSISLQFTTVFDYK